MIVDPFAARPARAHFAFGMAQTGDGAGSAGSPSPSRILLSVPSEHTTDEMAKCGLPPMSRSTSSSWR